MKGRLYALDVLRFVLAMLIVVLHFFEMFGYSVVTNYQNAVPLLGIPIYHAVFSHAVDVFFVLSGFTIYYSTRNLYSTREFLAKRVARIFPIYVIATLIAIPFWNMIPPTSPLHKDFTISYIVNSFILRPDTQPFIISVAWTLAFEWVFYMIFAFVLKISHKYRAEITSLILGICLLLTFVVSQPSSGYLNILLNDRMMFIEFISGMLIAQYFNRITLKQSWIYVVVGSIMMYMTVFTPFFGDEYRGFITLIPSVLIVFGCLYVTIPEKYATLARKLGDLSYTIYIMQTFTAFGFAYFIYSMLHIHQFKWVWMIVSLVITIIASYIVNRFIEKPLYKIVYKVLGKQNKQLEI